MGIFVHNVYICPGINDLIGIYLGTDPKSQQELIYHQLDLIIVNSLWAALFRGTWNIYL